MTQYRGRTVVMYYGHLIISASVSRPAARFYIHTARNDAAFVVEEEDGLWNIFHVLTWGIEETASLVECLDWCLEWYEQTFVEEFLSQYPMSTDSTIRRTLTTQYYWVGIDQDRDETWELRVDPRGVTQPLFIRKGFTSPEAAKHAFAHWLWYTEGCEITIDQVQRFIDVIASYVSNRVVPPQPNSHLIFTDSGDCRYAAFYEYPSTHWGGSGWVYRQCRPNRKDKKSSRLYTTKEEVIERIAKDIVYNGCEKDFGFPTFWEWLKEEQHNGHR